MSRTIVTREEIRPGDRVFSIDDHPLGVVVAVDSRSMDLVAFDSTRYSVPLREVFTAVDSCVTLQCNGSSLERFRDSY